MTMRVASRYLLPLELLMALQAIAWALSGGLGRGGLWQLLDARGENDAWLAVLGGVGFTMGCVSAMEWVLGRNWSTGRVLASVSVRSVCTFLMAVIWIYALHAVLVFDVERNVVVLTMMAPLNALFSVWAFVENLKVRYALDARYPTSRLRFHR